MRVLLRRGRRVESDDDVTECLCSRERGVAVNESAGTESWSMLAESAGMESGSMTAGTAVTESWGMDVILADSAVGTLVPVISTMLSMAAMAESFNDDSPAVRGSVASPVPGLENAPTESAHSSTIMIIYG